MNNTAKKQVDLLSKDATGAVQQMVKISRSLLDLAEKESQALVQQDMLNFSILQDEKELLAQRYTKTSEEFRNRLEEFRSVNPALISQLEALQNQLAEKTRNNTAIVEEIRLRAEQNTQKTLLTVQELGQQKPVRTGETGSQSQGA